MKADVGFTLENAGWPALLVDGASTICRANQAAVKLFGLALEGSSPLLSAIWAPENTGTADQFIAHWERSPSQVTTLKFRSKGGNTISLPVAICCFSKDGEKYFVLQFLPEPGQTTFETSRFLPDSAAAQKQKLDCALQDRKSTRLNSSH